MILQKHTKTLIISYFRFILKKKCNNVTRVLSSVTRVLFSVICNVAKSLDFEAASAPKPLHLKSWVRFSRNEIDIQVLVILPITLNKTLSNLYEAITLCAPGRVNSLLLHYCIIAKISNNVFECFCNGMVVYIQGGLLNRQKLRPSLGV